MHAPGLKGFAGWSICRKKLMVTRAKINRVVVEITRLDQNGKEVDSVKIFEEHHYVFA